MLLAVPIVGAAVLVAVLLGGDLSNLLQGGMREALTTIADALVAQPMALSAFITAFVIALLGGSALTFLVKGGIIDVMRSANDKADTIEHRPLTLTMLADAGAVFRQQPAGIYFQNAPGAVVFNCRGAFYFNFALLINLSI